MDVASAESLLLARIAAGDHAALDTLYTEYRPRLRRYLLQHLVSNVEQTEEVIQDVFVAVWQRAATFRGQSSVAAWLFSIARYQLHNARRHAQRRPEGHSLTLLTGNEEMLSASAQAPSPEETVIAQLTLGEALARLAPIHREVLDLAFYHGFALDEIAHILHIPSGTVKSRMHAARRALAHSLDVAEEVAPHER